MDIIFEGKVSGATRNREKLQKTLENPGEGDIIYVTDLTRSMQDLFELIDLIRSKKVSLNHSGIHG